jgi:hypothetical protein
MTLFSKAAFLSLLTSIAPVSSVFVYNDPKCDDSPPPNGGFESGDLAGWVTSGDVYVIPSNGNGFGSNMAKVSAGCPGSKLSRSFTAPAGAVWSGVIKWFGEDYLPFNDSGSLKLIQGSTSKTIFYADIATFGNYNDSPWTTYSEIIPADGTYTMELEVSNKLDCLLDSYVEFDVGVFPCTPIEGGIGGDPHMKLFNGKYYDFHGQCDLMMVHAPNFAHDLGLDVHIRTKIRYGYSFVGKCGKKGILCVLLIEVIEATHKTSMCHLHVYFVRVRCSSHW